MCKSIFDCMTALSHSIKASSQRAGLEFVKEIRKALQIYCTWMYIEDNCTEKTDPGSA